MVFSEVFWNRVVLEVEGEEDEPVGVFDMCVYVCYLCL